MDSKQDYLASDLSTIYPSTSTHSGYTHGIAGIGRDDESGLDHRASHSISTTAVISITHSGPISPNLSFLVWGHDGGDSALTEKVGDYMYTARTWRVAETGTITDVTVAISGYASS